MTEPPERQAEGEAVLASALEIARATWRERLTAAYALGSLAHGGFSPVSDVDLGLVLADPLSPNDSASVRALGETIKRTGGPYADRLSVFWGSVASLSGATPGGRFPPLDRLDLVRYGRLIAGADARDGLGVPTHEELVVAGAEFALERLGTGEVLRELNDPEALLRSDAKRATKLLLYPLRFLFTARTGDVGRNDAAVEHFVARVDGPAGTLARLALRWRATGRLDASAEARRAIADGALPIYREFLLDHEPRLLMYRRPDLARAFAQWRNKLEKTS